MYRFGFSAEAFANSAARQIQETRLRTRVRCTQHAAAIAFPNCVVGCGSTAQDHAQPWAVALPASRLAASSNFASGLPGVCQQFCELACIQAGIQIVSTSQSAFIVGVPRCRSSMQTRLLYIATGHSLSSAETARLTWPRSRDTTMAVLAASSQQALSRPALEG